MLILQPKHSRRLFSFDLNAYDPVPSPDGKLIAYVLTGRKLEGGSGGFGRSNLQSDVKFCDSSGQTLQNPYAEGFLGEWLPDSSEIVSFRDWKFSLLDPGGSKESQSMLPRLDGGRMGETSGARSVFVDASQIRLDRKYRFWCCFAVYCGTSR